MSKKNCGHLLFSLYHPGALHVDKLTHRLFIASDSDASIRQAHTSATFASDSEVPFPAPRAAFPEHGASLLVSAEEDETAGGGIGSGAQCEARNM